MRILHVYKDFFPHGGGGVARHIHGLAVLTAQAGHALRVAAPLADEARESGYEALRVGILDLWQQIGWANAVHVHGARTPVAAWAAILACLRGRRVIYTPHCYYDDDPAWSKRFLKRCWDLVVETFLLRTADRVVLLSAYWQGYLRKRGMSPARPLLLPNAVLEAGLPSLPVAPPALDGAPALLSVGRLDVVKRLHDAISVLSAAGMDKAVLHLVGRGPDRARLQDFAEAHGLTGRVRFHGFVADADVAAMAAAADVFVMPSAVEGMPTVLIEMLLLGCPVVASDIPGNRAILAEVGLHGALYPLGDVAALAACIAAQRRPVAPDTAALVRADFTWEGIRLRVCDLYDGLANQDAVS